MIFRVLDRLKFKKFHKIKLVSGRVEHKFFCPFFTPFGLQVLSSGRLTAKQLESSRLVIRRFFKKQVWLKMSVFPFISVTRKSTGARMGKGKGKPYKWVCPVVRGRVVMEILPKLSQRITLRRDVRLVLGYVSRKLPLKANTVFLLY